MSEYDGSNFLIYDCHAHFGFFEKKGIEPDRSNIMFNSVEDYKKHRHLVSDADSTTLIFDIWKEKNFVTGELDNRRVDAIKLIPRDQSLDESKFKDALYALDSVRSDVPIFYDSFRHGHDLRFQPCLRHVIDLAMRFPDRKIIVTHAGGHQLLDYFIHLRTLPNIYYDISLVLQYFYDSSVFLDIKKLIQHTSAEKLIFGSDYPWTSLRTQFEIFIGLARELKLDDTSIAAILHDNSIEILKP
jgi:predicted TIM-barrel fold metal-dependent hydrolase